MSEAIEGAQERRYECRRYGAHTYSRARRPPLGSAEVSRTGDSASSIDHARCTELPCFALDDRFFSKPLDESQ